jgi:antitoxin component YwqK of YwqJK toxin-antitoxin module
MRIVYAIVLTLFILGCSQPGESQEKNGTEQKKIEMEVFNIKKFNENKNEAGNFIFTHDDGTVITQFGNEQSGYFEYARKPGELFESRKGFHPNGRLKLEGMMYHNSFLKGEWKHYNPESELVKTVNHDEPFKYSWEDIQKLCDDKKINLLHSNTRITRQIEGNSAIWTVEWQFATAQLLSLTIDGRNGDVLKEEIIELDKG